FPARARPDPIQYFKMRQQRAPRYLHRCLERSNRQRLAGLHEDEEDLEPAQTREGLERLDVALIGRQLRQRQPRDRLHISKYMEMLNRCQSPRSSCQVSTRA